jgi:hypothetical protein
MKAAHVVANGEQRSAEPFERDGFVGDLAHSVTTSQAAAMAMRIMPKSAPVTL